MFSRNSQFSRVQTPHNRDFLIFVALARSSLIERKISSCAPHCSHLFLRLFSSCFQSHISIIYLSNKMYCNNSCINICMYLPFRVDNSDRYTYFIVQIHQPKNGHLKITLCKQHYQSDFLITGRRHASSSQRNQTMTTYLVTQLVFIRPPTWFFTIKRSFRSIILLPRMLSPVSNRLNVFEKEMRITAIVTQLQLYDPLLFFNFQCIQFLATYCLEQVILKVISMIFQFCILLLSSQIEFF